MDIHWHSKAWDDYQYWINNDPKNFALDQFFNKECQCTPFRGSGKPEPLKQNLSGMWSRRINDEHRLVCKVGGNVIYIVQCRYHY